MADYVDPVCKRRRPELTVFSFPRNNSSPSSHRGAARLTTVAALAAFILAALAVAFFFVRETPTYSLFMLKRAIIDHDAEKAMRYIDTDRIVDRIVADTFSADETSGPTGHNRWQTMMRKVGKEAIIQNLPAIKVQLREQLKSMIHSYNDETILAYLNKATVFAIPITVDGDKAYGVIPAKKEIRFEMARSGNPRWKIVAVDVTALALANGRLMPGRDRK